MPALANVILTDREGTPVNHTFTPRDIVNGLGTVVESTGVPVGENKLQVAVNRTASGKYKGILKMALPIVQTQTINGVSTPVVVRTTYIDLAITYDGTSTLQERKNAVGMLASALAEAKVLVNDTLVKLEGVY
jgi:hypothetical protein